MRLFLFYILSMFFVINVSGQVVGWLQYPDAPFAERDDAVGVRLNDFAYIGTGLNSDFSLLDDWWSYNLWTGEWAQLAHFPGDVRQYASAFALNDRVYLTTGVGGGNYYNDLWEYNPEDDTWSEKTAIPDSGRSSCAVFTIGDFAYLCGGFFGLADHSNEVWRYSTQSDSWTPMTALPAELRLAAGFAFGGMGYVAGGFNEVGGTQSSTYKYNPVNDSWTTVGSIPEPRLGAKAVVGTNTPFLICGGITFSDLSDAVYFFDPQNEQWYNFETFIGAPRKGGVAFSGDSGMVFFGTGISEPPQNQRFNDMYILQYPVSVLELGQLEVQVFPNPVGDFIQLKIPDNNLPFQLTIKDLRGVIVREPQQIFSGNQFDISFLSPGIYVLTLVQEETILTTKLVKSR